MTDTIKHMWDQVEQNIAAGTFSSPEPPMSTEADIVERLRGMRAGTALEVAIEADDLCQEAAAEITMLRAERDAAARDMRERCASIADDRTEKRRGWTANGYIVAKMDEADEIAAEIRALPDTPAVMATSGKDAT